MRPTSIGTVPPACARERLEEGASVGHARHLIQSKGLHKGNLLLFAAMPRTMLAMTALVAAAVAVTAGQAPALEVLALRPNFYMIAGAGSHIAVQVCEGGVGGLESRLPASSEAVLGE